MCGKRLPASEIGSRRRPAFRLPPLLSEAGLQHAGACRAVELEVVDHGATVPYVDDELRAGTDLDGPRLDEEVTQLHLQRLA